MPLELKQITHRFGFLDVLDGIDMDVPDGQVAVLLGPSGCGKTTLLNIVSGAVVPTTGSIVGRDGKRLSYLYQEPRLLPWRTVAQNLEFVLDHVMPEDEIAAAVSEVLETVDLLDFSSYYPNELSGGMRQRVALARAFAFPGDLLLMDEPFRALDLKIKASLAQHFARSWKVKPRTTVYVTHDIQEALLIGDVIHVLSDRPARIVSTLAIALKRESRSLADEDLIGAEREIYRLLG